MPKLFSIAIAGLLLATLPMTSSADDSPDGGEHHGPRPEAIAACKDKKAGDACEFDAPRGHVQGACQTVRTGDLACVHPHHHHRDEGQN